MKIDNKFFYNYNLNFSSNRLTNKSLKCYVKPIIKKNDITLEKLKNNLLNVLNKKNNIEFNDSFKNNITTSIHYSKTINQLKLVDIILKTFSLNEDKKNFDTLKEIILAATNTNVYKFVSKILTNNSNLIDNNNFLTKLESILYSFYTQDAYNSRDKLFDKIFSEKILYKNEDFMNNLGSILYHAEDNTSSYKTIKILEGVLANESLATDNNFIKVLGQVLALRDIARSTNKDFINIIEDLNDNKQINILKSIASILGKEGSDIFVDVMNNKKLLSDEEFLNYLPNIIYTISKKNISKAHEIINYIQKNKSKHSKEFNKEIIFEYMYGNYDSLAKLENFVKLKLKACEKKSQLENFLASIKITDNTIDDFFHQNREIILHTIELLGNKNFVHAFSLKLKGLKDLCEICSYIKENTDEDYYQKLLLKINPSETTQYIELKQKISELKKMYPEIIKSKDDLLLKNIQNEINTLTKKTEEILSNKLNYDPLTVINRIETIGRLIDSNNDKKHNEFIDIMKDSTPENDLEWKTYCYKELLKKLNIEYDDIFIKKLDLINNKYFGNIMIANNIFYEGLRKIILLIKNNPDKSIKEIFNDLPSNKITRAEFEKDSINYDKFVDFDEKSFIELKIKNYPEEGSKKITVKKVDMNNIAKALFLGNEVSCCTKVGRGIKQETVSPYIMNKLVGAIEALDSDVPIGNTMCYFAKVDGEVSFILDNIELLPNYKNNNIIRDLIFRYAEKLCAEVGKPNIPIYVSGHRNDIDLQNFETTNHSLRPIGSTGDDKIYLDFSSDLTKIDPNNRWLYNAELTKII